MTAREALEFRRGDILWIQCDPSVGVEPRKTRTCIVVSNDVANRYGQAVTVVPTQTHTPGRAARAYMVDLPFAPINVEGRARGQCVHGHDLRS